MNAFIKLLAVAIVIASLEGCVLQNSNPIPNPANGLSHGRMNSGRPKSGPKIPSLILANSLGPSIDLFTADGNQYGSFKVPARGWVALDKQGDIYLSGAYQYSNTIEIYAPPYNRRATVVSLAKEGYVRGVAVDWKTGVFAVGTQPAGFESHSEVTFFRHGSTTPCATVPVFQLYPPLAFDSHSVLFFAFASSDKMGLGSVSGLCDATKAVTYSPLLPNIIGFGFTPSNDLLVDESFGLKNNGPKVTFAHPANGKLGKILATTMLDRFDGVGPTLLTLSSDGKTIWASAFTKGLAQYQYPEGGAPLHVIDLKRIYSGAVYPPPDL